MTEFAHVTGTIETISFSGFGGPKSGEMIVRIVQPNKTGVTDLVSLHLGWANGLNASQTDNLIDRWKTLVEAYCTSSTVSICYRDIGLSLPEIVEVV